MSEDRKYRWVGTRPIRHDGVDKVTGRANFGADFSLPGMLHGSVLRSPHAHARIVSIDVKPALALDGVKAVITSADLPEITPDQAGNGPTDFRDLSRNVLARDKVLYDGHPVAALAAKMAEVARRGGGRVEADYRNGAQDGTLTQIMWGRLPSGATTIREITCLDNGNERCYDKTYELDVTTLIIVAPDGHRCSLPAKLFLE